MKSVLYPSEFASKIDNIQVTISSMEKKLQEKDNNITLLQAKFSNLGDELDTQQQYTRHPNHRIYGIRETTENDDINAKVLSLAIGWVVESEPRSWSGMCHLTSLPIRTMGNGWDNRAEMGGWRQWCEFWSSTRSTQP